MVRTTDDPVKKLHNLYRYELSEVNEKFKFHRFQREVEGETHVVLLEDRLDDVNVRDYLIFSFLRGTVKSYFDNPADEQYPLTLGEINLFMEYLEHLENA